jgi:Leucine-rich repeat (LRR) protein
LALERNNLLGPIPSSIGKLTGLTSLYLYSNKLVGLIPSSIGQLTALTKLFLDDNALTGSIPSSFANLTKLVEIELQDNRLTGKVPALPFAQYTEQCSLDNGPSHSAHCTEPNCNHFDCPLPTGSDQCQWGFSAGVHCA